MDLLMRRRAAAICLAALLSLGGSPRAEADPPGRRTIVVVVAATSRIDNLSMDQLRNLFKLSATSKLRPLNLPPHSAERVGFDRIVLGMSAAEGSRYWIDRKIRGQSGPPRVIPNGALLARIVARVPNTIGYAFDGPLPEGVKVVPIDGLRPGDPRYPLLTPKEGP
jgi:hypothetical protein